MTASDTKVGDHAGHMRRSHSRTAVTGDHRVLQSTGESGKVVAGIPSATEKIDGEEQSGGFQREGDAVAPTEAQCALTDESAADETTGEKGGEDGERMKRDVVVGAPQFHADRGDRAAHMTERLVMLAEKTDGVDDAGGKRENKSAEVDPAGCGVFSYHGQETDGTV